MMVWLIGLALAAISTTQAGPQPDRFAYKLEMTPQEAHVDPAIEARYTARFQTCQKNAVATPQVANCFETEFARQDLVLNRVWKTTLRRIDPAHRAALVQAERDCAAQRNSFCGTVSDAFKGGTIVPVVYSNCRVEQTIRRTMWLERLR